MAALIGHGTLGYSFFAKNALLAVVTAPGRHDVVRYKSKKNKRPQTVITAKWEWDEKSLRSRGFLRSLKPYEPTGDVSKRLDDVCQREGISNDDSSVIEGLGERFELLVACEKEFNYAIPNSALHDIQTIGNLREFYKTPINTTVPLEATRKIELPKNLHIQYDYNRFHPDTDTKFGGKTAFPKSSTLVTGLKYKKKYPSLIQKNPFT